MFQAIDATMCDETVYFDLNYSLQYSDFGTDHIKAKVSELQRSLHNSLFTHSNFVFLERTAIKEMLVTIPGLRRHSKALADRNLVFNI